MKKLLFTITLSFIINVFFLSSCSKDSTPTDTEEPSVSFKILNNARVGETVTLTNTSQYCTSYEWDFGDGNSSTEKNPTHSYSSTGVFLITLTANGEGGNGSIARSIAIWDLVLENTFLGGGVTFEGPTDFKSQPVKINFYNQGSGRAAANLVKHRDHYSHQDMLDIFVGGISYEHHNGANVAEVKGFYKEIEANNSDTWIGNLEPGLYTLVSASIDPFCVYYVAGLTVQND